jgi:hypothetical protein
MKKVVVTTVVPTLTGRSSESLCVPNFSRISAIDVLLNKRVSEQVLQASWNVAASASAAAMPIWHEDFRKT